MERKKVLITMEPDTLAELDRLRGKEPRARINYQRLKSLVCPSISLIRIGSKRSAIGWLIDSP